MTANQLAYASNEIQREHYERVDALGAESNRIQDEHNVRQDALSAQRNDLEKRAQDIDYWYKQQTLQIQQAYNKAQISLIEYEQRLKDAQTQYQINKTEVDNLLAANEVERTNETIRHNRQQEGLGSEANAINRQSVENNFTLDSKRIEYQKQQWNTENYLSFERFGLQLQELGLKQYQAQNQVLLGLFAEARQREQLQLSKDMFSHQKVLDYSNAFRNYATGVNQIGQAASNLLKGLLPSISK